MDVDSTGNNLITTERQKDSLEVRKLNPVGTEVWKKSLSTRNPLLSSGTSNTLADAGGNRYIASAFSGTVDFDPGSRVKNISDPGAVQREQSPTHRL